ncbi:hypothetical protein Anapl_17774 [Anas platyrhynchos]|uniref:Uncharacterized protein n=1 Tax=Anas platyrhynchos TaxID=8839 RepID=R0J8M0_ANAPL|nr:hypothetical protein Anapl_17774 [Anas platyrhynchos]
MDQGLFPDSSIAYRALLWRERESSGIWSKSACDKFLKYHLWDRYGEKFLLQIPKAFQEKKENLGQERNVGGEVLSPHRPQRGLLRGDTVLLEVGKQDVVQTHRRNEEDLKEDLCEEDLCVPGPGFGGTFDFRSYVVVQDAEVTGSGAKKHQTSLSFALHRFFGVGTAEPCLQRAKTLQKTPERALGKLAVICLQNRSRKTRSEEFPSIKNMFQIFSRALWMTIHHTVKSFKRNTSSLLISKLTGVHSKLFKEAVVPQECVACVRGQQRVPGAFLALAVFFRQFFIEKDEDTRKYQGISSAAASRETDTSHTPSRPQGSVCSRKPSAFRPQGFVQPEEAPP